MKHILARANREILRQFAWSNLLLAFDFDGTLAPVVDAPSAAEMRPRTRTLLGDVSRLYPVAVISSRPWRDLRDRLRGIHVVDATTRRSPARAADTRSLTREVRGWLPVLGRRLAGLKGVTVEDKTVSVAVHTRESREKRRAASAIRRAAAEMASVASFPANWCSTCFRRPRRTKGSPCRTFARKPAGELRAAREMLVQCAKPACNEFLRQERTTTYNRLETDIPSVISVVTNENGKPYPLADVRMDGELLTSKLAGKALPVDPGSREFSFSTAELVFNATTQTFDRRRRSTGCSPARSPTRPIPTTPKSVPDDAARRRRPASGDVQPRGPGCFGIETNRARGPGFVMVKSSRTRACGLDGDRRNDRDSHGGSVMCLDLRGWIA